MQDILWKGPQEYYNTILDICPTKLKVYDFQQKYDFQVKYIVYVFHDFFHKKWSDD